MPTLAPPLAGLAIAAIAGAWFKLVSEHVPEPYLDEVFHVPQAQRYCRNNWAWDPKITTPPGLHVSLRQYTSWSQFELMPSRYLASVLLKPILGGCDTSALRSLNVAAICVLWLVAYSTLRTIRKRGKEEDNTERKGQLAFIDAHSALNISLFPPLFFFSALYYTDVLSTLLVLLSYKIFLTGNYHGIQRGAATFAVGFIALLFRQTNIFWVAVFPAGLSLIENLKTQSNLTGATKDGRQFTTILRESWEKGAIHDVPVHKAALQDYVILITSVPLAILRSPLQAMSSIVPYVLLLVSFASFVAWNGGVVLGDKSNHVATVHTPQMLYIWPYMSFFSLPLIGTPLLYPVIQRLPIGRAKTRLQSLLARPSQTSLPNITVGISFLVIASLAVHYNTIIHPFTLADNRHYVFYVFRILRCHRALKYAAVPVYYLCASLSMAILGVTSHEVRGVKTNGRIQPRGSNNRQRMPCQASFIIVWLVSTALSVISAPLVEPRYFIIPWMMWRLHVPEKEASLSPKNTTGRGRLDIRLTLETAWLLSINAAVGYLFLYRGFSWPNEPGKVQRFMF